MANQHGIAQDGGEQHTIKEGCYTCGGKRQVSTGEEYDGALKPMFHILREKLNSSARQTVVLVESLQHPGNEAEAEVRRSEQTAPSFGGKKLGYQEFASFRRFRKVQPVFDGQSFNEKMFHVILSLGNVFDVDSCQVDVNSGVESLEHICRRNERPTSGYYEYSGTRIEEQISSDIQRKTPTTKARSEFPLSCSGPRRSIDEGEIIDGIYVASEFRDESTETAMFREQNMLERNQAIVQSDLPRLLHHIAISHCIVQDGALRINDH